ncbi:MAG: glycosyltransferase family 2 protein [Clostridia bacterium]|jgi:glycosyltransferase EpsE|nr:glycosyltransferase family 2 protein [Clostridia bacterium]
MEYKKVSVIMGAYNCEKYIAESIESIINQTYSNIELIICEDGSSDKTYEIAKAYAEKYPEKIILLKNEKNMGLNYTSNKCIKQATGVYITRQDADDTSSLTRIEKEVEVLENSHDIAFVGCNMTYFDDKGQWGKSCIKENITKDDLVHGAQFSHPTCCIRREILDEVGGYTEDKRLLRVEDYDLWFKIYAKGYRAYNLKEFLYQYREDEEAIQKKKFKYRINEMYVRFIGYKRLHMPITKYIYIFRPIIVGLLPRPVYKRLHRRKLKREMQNV